MTNLVNAFRILFMISLLCINFNCTKEKISTEEQITNSLKFISEDIILTKYSLLKEQAGNLKTEMTTFRSELTDQQLESVRDQWKEAREWWERSEAFLFGPVETKGIDPAIDSWPVNITDIEKILHSTESLNVDYIQSLDGSLKGFHCIEYLLWSESGKKEAKAFTPREIHYLIAAIDALVIETTKLYDSWNPNKENHVKQLASAGDPGSIYRTQKAALLEIAHGMVNLTDEIANSKINGPLELMDNTLEESRFSHNTTKDLINNMIGISSMYWSEGLTKIVANKDAALDDFILREIKSAIEALGDLPTDFSTAIPMSSEDHIYAVKAKEKVLRLHSTLKEYLIPLIEDL